MRPFKNIFIYKFDEPFILNATQLEEALSQFKLRDIGQDELETYGWLPAFSQSENLVEEMNNALFFRLGMFIKKLPRKAIQTEVEKRARDNNIDILNRARFKELEEVITNEFISKVYPEQESINAYIDKENGWLVVDASSERKASLLTAMLRKSLGSLPVVVYAPQIEMPLVMTDWLRSDLPSSKFSFLDEVEMKELSKDEGGSSKFKGIPLDSKEIETNLDEGWSVTKIGLCYEDIVSFMLDDSFILKRVRYLDQFQERLEFSEEQNAVAQSNAYLLADTVRNLMIDLYNMCYDRG